MFVPTLFAIKMLCGLFDKTCTNINLHCDKLLANSIQTEDPFQNAKDGEYQYKEKNKDFINPLVIAKRENKVKEDETQNQTKNKNKKSKVRKKYTNIGKYSHFGRIDPVITVQVVFMYPFLYQSNIS